MNATDAGRLAKAEGHEYERDLPAYLNEIFGGDHVTDGRPSTKVVRHPKEHVNKSFTISSAKAEMLHELTGRE